MSADGTGELIGKAVVYGLVATGVLGGGLLFMISLIKSITKGKGVWVIWCVLSGVVALVSSLLGVGVVVNLVGKSSLAHETDDPKYRIFSEDLHSHLDIPKSWKEKASLNDYAAIGATSRNEQVCAMVITDSKLDIAGGLEDFDQLTTGKLFEALGNPELSAAESQTMGGCPAIYHRLQGTTNGINIVYHRYSVETAKSYHQVIAWTSISKEQEMLPLMMEVIKSFGSDDGPPTRETVPGDQVSEALRNRVARVIATTLHLDGESVSMDQKLGQDLQMDALAMDEVLHAMEEEFGVTISENEIENLSTVADFAVLIEAKADVAN
ncbi:acyl carrier protein [Luteolibacter pohnpeiensis]|uniref:Acyl carrier protein n=1 Tax=Luteolibacter pohnpeiensis TaxID=454153 RepID=A0A934S1A9_9BACT|nr:acyl carrier protein [Luteolibacter pohnpeiensis]MBK1881410.1 acyl carrier protein [Luteolibacter pohnpeiensis]